MMRRALALADMSAAKGEVPVGAVVCSTDGEIIGEGHNQTIGACDPSAHAEIVALRQASAKTGNYRLPSLHMVVTLEPCAMCIGAIMQARLLSLVYAAPDPKAGACGSVVNLAAERRLNHHTAVYGGVYANEASEKLSAFFRQRR